MAEKGKEGSRGLSTRRQSTRRQWRETRRRQKPFSLFCMVTPGRLTGSGHLSDSLITS